MMTMSEWCRRTGRDPMRYDRRPLSEIMNDEIPYEKWEAAKAKP